MVIRLYDITQQTKVTAKGYSLNLEITRDVISMSLRRAEGTSPGYRGG